ncbi:MAG TPA: carboxypeptidase regulatory-like domain-containing protein [Terriglobales bacterium]|nr:carboxypeptidase regulatory-like domain-containing protein [Terriglobales bacterium]
MPVSRRNRVAFLTLLLACLPFGTVPAQASVGGSISGTIKDVTGAVIAGAALTATNVDTGVRQTVITGANGVYTFPLLSVGRYTIQVVKPDFQPYCRTGVVIDVNSALIVNIVLQLGSRTDTVTVNDSAVHLDATSTQMGEVIAGTKLTLAPLNGRSFTDLLALQPGIAPATSITSSTVQDVGASAFSPSGDLNPGTISVNGQREFANGFAVNGSDVEEDVNMGTAIIPNLDSVAEFRILTNNFDAEYGEFSGGQINVVTKSGTNAFHGDVFEFVRNTALDARNYFSPARAAFQQNQFGGTFGGPLLRNHIFFFADYQGTRQTQGVDTGLIPVPSIQDRSGNLADSVSLFVTAGANGNPTPTSVSGPYWANLLAQKLAYTVSVGEPYYTAGCISPSQCVFPNALVPRIVWSAPAQHLLQYIPMPNVGTHQFSTSGFNENLRDDKGAFRLDADTRWGAMSAYYFVDDFTQNNPYPTAQGGANVPGFNALNLGRAQLLSLGDTKTFGNAAVNEFHFSFLRDANDLGRPVGGLGVSLASQGFAVGPDTPGIVPLSPSTEGVESVNFNNLSMGTNTNQLGQANNTFQWIDNFSKLVGTHTLKFGGEFHYDQINTFPIAQFNGNFLFFGSETGFDFADFLLGVPSQYNQSQLQSFYGRNRYVGVYAEDHWHVRPDLNLNYGLRWDRIEPWYEKYNQLAVFEPGRQSVVFPGAPAGILFPTDPGVPRTLASPGNLDFAPRVGLAYSPAPKSEFWNKILGAPGDSAIRAGFGMFYTAIEALSIAVLSANAPYGTTYTSPAPPLFATPFIAAATGQGSQYFPVQLAPLNSSASHPDPNVNWSQYEPISGLPAYATANRIPYTEEYMLSLERKFGSNTLLTASYVGSQAHRLLVLVEANPGSPALCLSLSQPSEVAPSTPTCGPFGESNVYTTASGKTIQGTRGPLGPNFGSDTNQATIGNSSYNSFQLSLRHNTGRLEFLAGYTFSKSLDQSSNLGEEVNPLNPALSKALSAFDVEHNFVVSYSYRLPFDQIFRENRLTRGWVLSGISHFSTGFPVTLYNYGDNSLLGAAPNGINNYGVDEPQYMPGPLQLNGDPRNGKPYFSTALFGLQPLGTAGNAKRRFFFGPGVNNYDMALLKYLPITESKNLEFRIEAFNIFNHAQFYGPASVDGNINSASFGQVISAAAPRLMQAGIKFNF